MSFQKILVAVNNSPLGPYVFAAAIAQAQFNQAALKLLHCIQMIPEPTVPMPFDPGIQPNLSMNDYQTQQILMEEQIEEAQALLKRYRQDALARGVPIEADYQIGDAGHLLCEAAKEWKADLVVIGRRGRSGLEEALLGSVSNYVVHHAPCSVLVIQDVEPDTTGTTISDLSSVVTNPIPSYEG
jgi:nucleotide-binding universal stress UspA family protein